MTDITELALRLKLEVHRAVSNFNPQMNIKTRDLKELVEALEKLGKTSKARREAIDRTHNMFVRERDRANAAEEALEKAQRYIEELREWNAGLAQESFERQQLISELEPIRAAAEKLVRCKGRYHSEQNYRALAALFGVNTPDLPPLEHENVHHADAAGMEIAALRQRIAGLEREQEQLRPVGVMSEKAFHRLENSECRFIALWPRPGIFLQRKRPEDGVLVYARTAAAAGIKVEAE